MTQKRDSRGRFKAKTEHRKRNIAIGATTAVAAVAGLAGAAIRFGLIDRLRNARKDDADGARAAETSDGAQQPDGTAEAPYDFRPDALTNGKIGEVHPTEPAAIH
ncbi:hypothetical protein [Sphingosinithalassobacter portus]|uniref:hypothetical protein n=1 Tax=Stakelama portus TaxID=2676234 RepID=UPI000D6E8442|nr:hypothetical protein [Sphingosinithalassobacter portus]